MEVGLHRNMLLLLISLLLVTGCGDLNDLFKSKKFQEQAETTTSVGEKPPMINIALVLDNSGSMMRTDPNRMMIYSALVFTDMLPENSNLYVSSFPGPGTIGSERWSVDRILGAVTSWKTGNSDHIVSNDDSEIKDWIHNLEYNSQITIFVEPLERAITHLASLRDESSRQFVVFFSDGITDRGVPAAPLTPDDIHRQEANQLLENISALEENKIEFYSVILGSGVSVLHLNPLADATDGAILRAETPEDLSKKFANVFSKILQTRVENIALTKNTQISVSQYVKELILFVPEGKSLTTLGFDGPGGRRIHGNLSAADGFLRRDGTQELGNYQVIHINDPKAGIWNAKLEGIDNSNSLLVQNFDVFLNIDGKYPRKGLMGVPNLVRGRMVDSRGKKVIDPEFFSEGDFYFVVEYDGKIEKLRPNEDCEFELEIIPPDTLFRDLRVEVTNGKWLERKIIRKMGAKDGACLKIGVVDFGEKTPYSDGLYFHGIRWLSKFMGLPASEKWRQNKTTVSFRGTDPSLIGVVFKLNEKHLYDDYKMKLVDHWHRQRFVIDDNMMTEFYLDLDRDADPLDMNQILLPIVKPSQKVKITGDENLRMRVGVLTLHWWWRSSHLWLQWLMYLWVILFFFMRPFHYLSTYSTQSWIFVYSVDRQRKKPKPLKPSEGRIKALIMGFLLFPIWNVVSDGGKRNRVKPVNSFASIVRRMILFITGLSFLGTYLREASASRSSLSITGYIRGGRFYAKRCDVVQKAAAEKAQSQYIQVRSPIERGSKQIVIKRK
jgi:hypothetical protein